MRKVRVEKEMPFAKVGEEFEVKDYHIRVGGLRPFQSYPIMQLVADGWLSWVEEEKSLEEKFEKLGSSFSGKNAYANIAKSHYLEVFEKCCKEQLHDCSNYPLNYIRTALEEA